MWSKSSWLLQRVAFHVHIIIGDLFLKIYFINSADEMPLFDGEQHLGRLLQKLWRYQHHQKNYEKSLGTGIILKWQNLQTFQSLSEYFFRNWEEILHNAEKNLVLIIAAWVIKSYCQDC